MNTDIYRICKSGLARGEAIRRLKTEAAYLDFDDDRVALIDYIDTVNVSDLAFIDRFQEQHIMEDLRDLLEVVGLPDMKHGEVKEVLRKSDDIDKYLFATSVVVCLADHLEGILREACESDEKFVYKLEDAFGKIMEEQA